MWKFNPLARLDRDATSGATSTSTTSRTTRCTTAATRRSAARPAPSPATAARAAGPARRRPSAACTSRGRRRLPHARPTSPPPRPRGGGDPHLPRGGRRAGQAPCCCSPAARTPRCCCALAEKAFWPAKFPFPVMHVDTGHNFPEVDRVPRPPRSSELGRRADRGLGAGVDRQRPRHRRDRPARLAQPPADGDAARRDRPSTASRRPSAARAATRSGPGPRSACSRSATTSASGTPSASGPSCGACYNGHVKPGEHVRVFPLSNWTELDVWQYVAHGGDRAAAACTSPTRARSSRATGCSTRPRDFVELLPGEDVFEESVRFRTVGDMTLHRRGALERARRWTR